MSIPVKTVPLGNVAGIDPHKRTLTVTVLDERGGRLGTRTFKVSGHGHRAMTAWFAELGGIDRVGVEGASALGRHTAVFLCQQDFDVRDVCPTRTAEQARRRRQGKTDALDSERIAREVQADPGLPRAFKRAAGDTGPDPIHDQIALWHKARRSLLKSRQHILNEAESILIALPEDIQHALGDTTDVRKRLAALASLDRTGITDRVVRLRLDLLDQTARDVAELDQRDKQATTALAGADAPLFVDTARHLGFDGTAMAEWAVYGGRIPFAGRMIGQPAEAAEVEAYFGAVDRVNAVWMDNTTIVTVTHLLGDSDDGRFATPVTLWDLASFVRATVCFERIYHHSHPSVDDAAINGLLGEAVVHALPVPVSAHSRRSIRRRRRNGAWLGDSPRYGSTPTSGCSSSPTRPIATGWIV